MKMKLKEVQIHRNNLLSLGKKTFPSKMSFAISCNIEKFQKEVERIDKERKKLCEQYAEKDDEGNPVMVDSMIDGNEAKEYKIDKEDIKALKEEYESLLETEVDMDVRTVKMEVVEHCERSERYDVPTVEQLFAMSFMIEE